MTSTAWFILIALVSLSIASLSVRGWVDLRGERRAAFIGAILVCGVLGGVIVGELGESAAYAALGVSCGVAVVTLGPDILKIGLRLLRAVASRLGRGE